MIGYTRKTLQTIKMNYSIMNIPINGNDSELGGMLSVTSIRNTVIERRVVTPIETFSPIQIELRLI
jgi:hypothetical protein